MAYTIKSINGTELYVAKDAKDIREAAEEAAKKGAYLGGAYLTRANLTRAYLAGADLAGAYLAGAYLAGADLAGANLTRADLEGAYLAGAYLAGADLAGANLTRADLAGANLTRADLEGAYLAGANLAGAYLAGANLTRANLTGADLTRANLTGGVWGDVAKTLRVSLQAMNDGGRHWIKGQLHKYLDDDSDAYCSVGSLKAHSDGTTLALSKWLLGCVCAGGIESFNDHAQTTWEDVQAVFNVAVRHAERFAA